MACHALGRCRICARKHKIDVFGSEKDQHYMIERANLKLIILNTVCVVCIAKIERFVSKNDSELIFSSYIKEEEKICKAENNVDKPEINSPCFAQNDKARMIETEDHIGTEKCYGNEIDMADVDTQCASDPQQEKKSQAFNAGATQEINFRISVRHDIIKDAGTRQPQFPLESNIANDKYKLEREALARLVSMLERNGKRPRNCLGDESNQGDHQAPKSAALSAPKDRSEDRDTPKSCSSSVVSTVNDVEPSHDYSELPSSKKLARFLICDFCQKKFTHAGDLNKHRRKHTGEKPYECSQCQRKFAHASNLARHQRVHSGEKPFVCPKCDRGFTRRDKLVIHVAGGRCQIDNSKSNAAKPPVTVI